MEIFEIFPEEYFKEKYIFMFLVERALPESGIGGLCSKSDLCL